MRRPMIVVSAASASGDLVNGNVRPPGRLNIGCGTSCCICSGGTSSSSFFFCCFGGGLIPSNRVAETLKVRRSNGRLSGIPKEVLGPAQAFQSSSEYVLWRVGRWRRRVVATSSALDDIMVLVDFRLSRHSQVKERGEERCQDPDDSN